MPTSSPKKRKAYAAYGSRREEIVSAATRLFVKNGIAQTRMADVADAVGIDQANLRYHFPNHDSLMSEIARRTIDSRIAFVKTALEKAPKTPLATLHCYVRAYFDWAAANPEEGALFMYFYYLAAFKPEFTRLNEASRDTGRERISALIYRAIEEGQLQPPGHAKVPELARRVQSAILGETISAFTFSRVNAKESASQAWEMILSILQVTQTPTKRASA